MDTARCKLKEVQFKDKKEEVESAQQEVSEKEKKVPADIIKFSISFVMAFLNNQ